MLIRGDVFTYENHGNGHFYLVRLNVPDPPKRKTQAQVRKAMTNMTWDELRGLTREP
jgi:hypothetical protein